MFQAQDYHGHVPAFPMQKRMFWIIFLVLSLIADVALPFVWGLIATLPILLLSWWIVYRSDWF